MIKNPEYYKRSTKNFRYMFVIKNKLSLSDWIGKSMHYPEPPKVSPAYGAKDHLAGNINPHDLNSIIQMVITLIVDQFWTELVLQLSLHSVPLMRVL